MIMLMSIIFNQNTTLSNQVMSFNTPLLLIVGLVFGLIGLAFTSYRFVIGYFFAGMLYWLWVEGLHWVVNQLAPMLAVSDSYVLAVAVSLLPLLWLLALPHRSHNHTDAITTAQTLRMTAGQRPFVLEKDTNFYQHCIKHSAVSEK